MDVVSSCALRVASLVWQPRASSWRLTVICKATYLLAPGESALAAHQEEPSGADVHWNDDESRSLYSASELAPFKPRADVLLVGHAFAPRGAPVKSLVARLVVGDLDKSIEIFGDRGWTDEGTLREASTFTRMPLIWERAAFGPSNPVGVREGARRDHFGHAPVPNLQPPGLHLGSPHVVIPPIGFGPITPTWPARAERLGAHAAAFDPRSWAHQPLPEGVEGAYFNVAPSDQQIEAIRPGVRIGLENLHPEQALLATKLPKHAPRATVERHAGVGVEELRLRCDTLAIDTDRARVTVIWRGQLTLAHPNEAGRVTISLEEASPIAHAPAVTEFSGAETVAPWNAEAARAPLPFAAGTRTVAAPPAPPSAPAWPTAPAYAPPPMVRAPIAIEAPPTPPPSSPWAAAPIAAPPIAAASLSLGQMAAKPAIEPALGGAADASTAAARASAIAGTQDDDDDDDASPVTERPKVTAPPQEIVSLVWIEPGAVARARRKPSWREILDALELEAPDADLDGGERSGPDAADRRDAFALLARGPITDAPGLRAAINGAVRTDGSFVAPLAIVAGTLELGFDELEILKATVTTATPFTGGDKELKDIVDSVNDMLQTPWIAGSTSVAEALTTRLREAFSRGKRGLPTGYLDAHTERRLLEQRHYRRRTMFGRTWLRAALLQAGASDPIPAYLPESLARDLPLYQRFPARLLAEVHWQQDQFETHPLALKVLAVARVMPLAGTRL